MCAVEATHLRSPPIFKELCESKGPADCCPGWSLGGYIAVLHKRSSCFSLEVSFRELNMKLGVSNSCNKYTI